MLGLGGLGRPTDSLNVDFFFLISQTETEEHSCGFMFVVSCNVLGSIGFFIVGSAFYKVVGLRKSWQRVRCGRGETINLFPYFHFLIFVPQNSVAILHTPPHF